MKCKKCGITLTLDEEIEDGICLQCSETIDEKLSRFSDRQIVAEVLNILTEKQLQQLVDTLEKNY